MDNLVMAYGGEKNRKELRAIARSCYRSWGRSGVEVLRLWDYKRRGIDFPLSVEGLENLKEAHAKGRGVVLAQPHMGAFPLIAAPVFAEEITMVWVLRWPKSKRLHSWLNELLSRCEVRCIDDGNRLSAVRESMELLKSGGVLGLQVDQNAGGKTFVDFFGRKAATATGAATLSVRCRAPLVPAYIYWKGNGHHVVFEKPVTSDEKENDAVIADLTAQTTARVEAWVREHPEQWLWMHRRWKTRPTDE